MKSVFAHIRAVLNGLFWHPIIRGLGRILFWTTIVLSSVFLVGFVALLIAVNKAMISMPSYNEIRSAPTAVTIRYHASNGKVIYESGPAYGAWIDYQHIPKTMTNAIISIEDRRFFNHYGIDPVALIRITKTAIINRGRNRRLQGASTITQQAARTLFLNRQYEVGRKIKEMVLALAMEQKFTKNQILEIYLNTVYFGGGAHGIDAASRTFFGHTAQQMSNSEAAIIAGAAKAPSQYAPSTDPKTAIDRSKTVLTKMEETGRLSHNDFDNAIAHPPAFRQAQIRPRDGTRYFLDWISPQMQTVAPLDARTIDVYTTLDIDMQKMAETALDAQAGKNLQGAIITLDNSGAIRVIVGGKSYTNSNYNRATQAVRQPGSSFKPFVYMTALENGYTPSSMVLDAPITVNGWSPQNNSRHYSGMMTLSSAFAWSVNSVAVRLAKDVGFRRVINMAQRFGITTTIPNMPSISLGSAEVRVIEMARAYSIISNKGQDVLPYGIDTIRVDNRIIYQHPQPSPQAIIRPNVAARMTKLMAGTVQRGTGTAAQIGRPMAGKTGTTSSGKDGWFIGFSSGYTTAIWIGRDDARPIAGLQGGRTPARVFATYMKNALKKIPETPLIIEDPEPGAVQTHTNQSQSPTTAETAATAKPAKPESDRSTTMKNKHQTNADRAPKKSIQPKNIDETVVDNTKSHIIPME